jgi:hypothetical protein
LKVDDEFRKTLCQSLSFACRKKSAIPEDLWPLELLKDGKSAAKRKLESSHNDQTVKKKGAAKQGQGKKINKAKEENESKPEKESKEKNNSASSKINEFQSVYDSDFEC